MSTAIDSNVLIALWNEDGTLNTQARSALDAALARGSLVVAAPVFAELLAAPPGRRPSLIPSAKKPVLRWIGISMKPLGALQGVPSNSTWLAEETREIPARGAFLPTSSSELTLCTMDSGS